MKKFYHTLFTGPHIVEFLFRLELTIGSLPSPLETPFMTAPPQYPTPLLLMMEKVGQTFGVSKNLQNICPEAGSHPYELGILNMCKFECMYKMCVEPQ